MVNIGKRQVRGYILLESLLAMALLALLATVVVTEISRSRTQLMTQNKEIEVLNTGLMAFDAGQSSLSANHVTVDLAKTSEKLVLATQGREVLRLEILSKTD
ncbi:competence type IV pilus minor pilin ComGE [Pseudolactococcus insecticola]|uniref:Competence protein ComGE n=1 Tax=Pseudolactococcus insecticola TaxID=2709158 RepID=A0A6A0B9V0_9LACT|nr:competence type IV pilus minor pilin ComGE [Lactococcus insecticola]GFH41124.1 hypothetical protein Hs20B_15220 [Lactococcus insecticola]